MRHKLPADRLNHRLPELYLVFALLITTLLVFLTPPFFTPDEPHHAARSLSLAHGFLTPHLEADQAGAAIDTNALHVMDASDTLRMAWERQSPDFHDRHYGPMADRTLPDATWTNTRTFAPFPNTAVYPPTLYLPAIAAWGIAPHLNLTILQSLRLARFFCALTAVLLGWLALRLSEGSRLLLLPFLLLPSTLFLNASCSQDAVLLSLAALLVAVLTRPLVQRRAFTVVELLVSSAVLAMCATARPPYLALSLLLFLPAAELPGSSLRRYLAPLAGFLSVSAASALWRAHVLPFGLDTSDEADPARQLAFLRAHPFAALEHILRGTGEAATDFVHRGLYVVGWNDLLPPHALSFLLAIVVGVLLLAAPPIPLRSWVGRLLLTGAVVAPLLGISLAEYLIWTPPGHATVYGIQPRYWLPVLPAATLLLQGRLQLFVRQGARLLLPATVLLILLACTLPWFVAKAFYMASILQVLHRVL
jgi:uncharacterized membrane protein